MRIPKMLLGTVLSLVLGACGGGGSSADISSSGEVSTSTEPTTTEASTTSTSTTTPAPTTTRRPAATTIAVATTRQPVTPVPTSTTVAGGVRCSAAQLTVEVTTDRATYRPGERVQARATLRNRSTSPCFYNSYTAAYRFDGPSGQVVAPGATLIADAFADTPLPAGAMLTQTPTWDQQACPSGPPCSQAPPGSYTVRASWGFEGPLVVGSATFVLAAT